MKKKINKYLVTVLRQSFIYAGIVTFVGLLLVYKLGSLVPGLSQPEVAARAAARSGQVILDNPLFLPHKLIQYGLFKIGYDGILWTRLISAGFAALILVAFYRILRTWYSVRIAMLCSFLFLCSAWFLHYARLGTPEILYAGSIGLLWAGIRLKGNDPRASTIIIGALILLGSLYVPGLAWIVVPALIWRHKYLIREIGQLPKALSTGIYFCFLVGVEPLVYSFVKNPLLIRDWLAIPAAFHPTELISNLWHLPLWLTLRGPEDAVHWLGRIPLLDAFSVVMFGIGIYVYVHYMSLDRVRTILGILVVGALLGVANGPWLLIVIAPFIFMAVATGIALLLQQWFTVFPRNPLARSLGLVMVGAIVVMAAFYHVNHYFVAWPKSPATRQAFHLK